LCETGQLDVCVQACVDSAGSGGGGNSGGYGNSGGVGSGGAGNAGGGNSGGSGNAGGGNSGGSGNAGAGGNTGGSGNAGGGSGASCCTTQTVAGCADSSVESCVCAGDDYCCKVAWDSLCVDEVDSFGCGTCGSGGGGGSGGSGGAGGSGATGGSGGTGGTGGSGGTGGGGGSGGFPVGAVSWLSFPEQTTQSNSGWSSYMTDIIRHLPSSYGNTYYDSDKVTYVHETTHGINSHLRNYFNNTGKKANGFYVGGNKGVIVIEPNIWKSDANSFVPTSLRESRYDLYLAGSSAWNDTPLYLFDEWIAYTNGTEAAVNLVKEGKWNAGWRDTFGSLEFTVYAFALAMAVEAKDSTYFQSYAQFRELLKWNAERAMTLYQQARVMTEFKWAKMDTYYNTLKTSSDAANLRAFIQKTYGNAWSTQVMGF